MPGHPHGEQNAKLLLSGAKVNHRRCQRKRRKQNGNQQLDQQAALRNGLERVKQLPVTARVIVDSVTLFLPVDDDGFVEHFRLIIRKMFG